METCFCMMVCCLFQTHADYNETDEYITHRVVQAYELSQFIKHTSEGCDAVIVGGDFNFKPEHPAFQMALANSNLQDSWLKQVLQLHLKYTNYKNTNVVSLASNVLS